MRKLGASSFCRWPPCSAIRHDLPVEEKLILLLPPLPTLLYPSLLETHRTIAGGLGHAHGDGGHRRGGTSPATGCSASSTVWMSSLSTFLGAGLVVLLFKFVEWGRWAPSRPFRACLGCRRRASRAQCRANGPYGWLKRRASPRRCRNISVLCPTAQHSRSSTASGAEAGVVPD